MWVLLLLSAAIAGPPDDAEARRLADRMHTLAVKHAWSGVERTWDALAEAENLTAREFLTAADAAQHLGDLGAARERLLAALSIEERREIIERLWAIDTAYGAVRVVARAPVDLEPPGADFFPVARQAIQRAKASLAESGSYAGWLPVGRYRIGGQLVEVMPGPREREVDLD